jgi:DNA polymerase III alpha subunit
MNSIVDFYRKQNRMETVPIKAEEVLRPAFIRPIPKNPAYEERVCEEFALIDRNNFTRVFLQVQEIMRICKRLQIPHIIRGSAGSSLICYLMGISHTDPLAYNMDLTRFMNHGRTDMPDIDIDVPYNRRDELYSAIGAKWPNQVARISNHVLYKYKSALQEAMRIHAPKISYKKNTPIEQLVRDPEVAAKIRECVHETIGTLRTESLHCGGIVIFDKEGCVPADLLLKEEEGKLPQIRLNKDETEDAGFIKIDVLSNRGMAQWWEASGGTKSLLEYPKYDEGIVRLFSTGDTIGITFGESRGQRNIYKQLMPTSVEDIAIALALIRPAAAAGGRKSAFLAAHRAGVSPTSDMERPIVYDDDALARIRAVFHYKGASSFPKETVDALADRFRKAFAKQRMGECLQFRDICRAQEVPEPIIKQLIDDLDQLQHYSFCKSHALSYAQLVWALAYEKVHHPHRFWVAALNHCNSEYRRWVHWREARTSGLKLTRGAPPYKLGVNKVGEPIMISAKGEQLIFAKDDDPQQMYRDMKQHGYWLSSKFFPGCYKDVAQVKQRKLRKTKNTMVGTDTPEYEVRFCGLIATGRVVRCETDGDESHSGAAAHCITFICIGYDNGKYLDLVIHGPRGYLLGWAAVEGVAICRRPDSEDALEVKEIQGVSLATLQSR